MNAISESRTSIIHTTIAVASSLLCVTGCVALDEGFVASDHAELGSSNQITLNSLTMNAIELGTLASNSLASSGPGNTVHDFNPVSGLHETAEGRQVLAYIALCVLPEGESLEVEGIEDPLPGLLGLAPSWTTSPLSDDPDRRLVSACLLAHVNAYGQSVEISVRADGQIEASPGEIASYSVFEGVFFGDMFASVQKMYACQGDDETQAMNQASSRAFRVCTDDTPDCQMTALGSCEDVCASYDSVYGWTNCWADGTTYSETVSVYLFRDDPGA